MSNNLSEIKEENRNLKKKCDDLQNEVVKFKSEKEKKYQELLKEKEANCAKLSVGRIKKITSEMQNCW